MDGLRTLAISVTMAPHLKFALGPINSLNGPAYLSIPDPNKQDLATSMHKVLRQLQLQLIQIINLQSSSLICFTNLIKTH